MHSSTLRGKDFKIVVDGSIVEHATYFDGHARQRRVGLVAPQRVDGVGAMTLVMAHVTAFYDRYRAEGVGFFAYPDYYSFQTETPLAHYSNADIWPNHKNVLAGETPVDRLNAINDRAINTLIVPDVVPTEHDFERTQLECARRTIDCCYLYAFTDAIADADVVIECEKKPLVGWANSVFETEALYGDKAVAELRAEWDEWVENRPKLTQTFKRISLDEALQRL